MSEYDVFDEGGVEAWLAKVERAGWLWHKALKVASERMQAAVRVAMFGKYPYTRAGGRAAVIKLYHSPYLTGRDDKPSYTVVGAFLDVAAAHVYNIVANDGYPGPTVMRALDRLGLLEPRYGGKVRAAFWVAGEVRAEVNTAIEASGLERDRWLERALVFTSTRATERAAYVHALLEDIPELCRVPEGRLEAIAVELAEGLSIDNYWDEIGEVMGDE